MAVAVGTTANNAGNFADTITVSTTTAGSNRHLVVVVGWGFDQTVSSVTFGGTALQALGAAEIRSGVSVHMWEWNIGTNGEVPAQTADVVVTMTGAVSSRLSALAIPLTGVHQTTPSSGFDSDQNEANGGTQPTLTITSATGDLVLDGMTCNDTAVTVGADQTQLFQGGFTANACASSEPGAATVNMTWSALANFTTFVHVAANIQQAAAAGGGAVVVRGLATMGMGR
jgi:hypothetical protein